ncbi:MAG TPA: hypothetical protein VEP90_03905, partial [Methylomirabilota bacterium]|nr:hypothetical protein [Methylomirabilota bacterium]
EKFVPENERDSVKIYKKGLADEEAKQHRALTIPSIPIRTTMRLYLSLLSSLRFLQWYTTRSSQIIV